MKEFLEYPIISFREYHLYVYEVLGVLLILLAGFLIDRLFRWLLYRNVEMDRGTQYALHRISRYVVMIFAFFLSMKMLSIDISPLLVGSSAILVGIGLGLQNLFLDFISGVIILFDRSVKVGDVLDMNGVMGKVIQINLRTSKLLTVDNREMIFPNAYLIKNSLINYTSSDGLNSFTIDIGVDYNTDLELAQKLLVEAAQDHLGTAIDETKKPFTRLVDFGAYAIVLRLLFFVEDPFAIGRIQADIRMSILKKFREHHISIPFPITTTITRNEKSKGQ